MPEFKSILLVHFDLLCLELCNPLLFLYSKENMIAGGPNMHLI